MSAAVVIHELVLFASELGFETVVKYGTDEEGDSFFAWVRFADPVFEIGGHKVNRLVVVCDPFQPIVDVYTGPVDKYWRGPSVEWSLENLDAEFLKRGYEPTIEWLEMMEDLRCPVDEDTF